MAYWIELHCDIKKGKCYSNRNNNPGALSRGNALRVALKLGNEARSMGWKFINGKWICPECQK